MPLANDAVNVSCSELNQKHPVSTGLQPGASAETARLSKATSMRSSHVYLGVTASNYAPLWWTLWWNACLTIALMNGGRWQFMSAIYIAICSLQIQTGCESLGGPAIYQGRPLKPRSRLR